MQTFTKAFHLTSSSKLALQIAVFLMLISFNQLWSQTTYTTTANTSWSAMTWSPTGTPGPNDHVVIAHNVTANTDVNIQNLTVNASRTLTISSFNFTVNGTTSVSGTLTDNNVSGSNLFIGMLTINSGGVWNLSTANAPCEFRGGITNNGTMTATGTGLYTFSSNNQEILGNNAIVINGAVNINGAITVENKNNTSVRINGILDGLNPNAAWLQGPNSVLILGNNSEPMATAGIFNAQADGNTVNYASNSGIQSVRAGTYFNITLSNGATRNVEEITVQKDFVRSGGNVVFNGNITFTSGNAGVYTMHTNYSIDNVIINKPGSSLTISSFGFNAQNLNVVAGTLAFGNTNTTINISNSLSGNGTIDMTGATHVLNLTSVNNSIGELITGSNTSTVHYSRNGDQNIFGSNNYFNLQVSGGGTKILTESAAVINQLNMSANCLLELGNSDLKLRSNATLAGAFGVNRYIVTNGSGSLWKEFTAANALTTHIPSGIFPVGSGGHFTSFQITSFSATVFGTAYISVRAVPTRQPNVPYFNNALLKHWDIETSNINAINANLRFTFNSNEVMGSVLEYEPRVWNGTTLSATSNPSAPGSNPFTVTGTSFLTGEWTAIDPTVRTVLYSYQSGDWNDLNTWTTDPSGSTLVSPMIPTSGNQVVILNGRTVSTSTSRSVAGLTINQGGTLDLGASSGHSFVNISGQGRLRLSTINLPAGVYTNFVSQDGGTIEFYNLPAGAHELMATNNVFNHLEISNTTANAFSVGFGHNLTLNGNLTISKTGSAAQPTFKIGGASGNQTLSIFGNVTIGAGCRWDVRNPSGNHTVILHGNLTNSGHIEFTNGAANASTTNGTASIIFRGATSNTVFTGNAGSYAKFFGFTVDKNDNFELAVSAASSATVLFHGNGRAISADGGILRLGSNITVPSLNNNGNYDIGTSSRFPVLWIDGATVTYNSNGAIVPYGTLRISSGTLNCLSGQGAVVLRESGLLQIDGGVVNMHLFRITVFGGLHRGAFIQTGGVLNISGDPTSEGGYYAAFSLPYPENVFKMSGGTINIGRSLNGSISGHAGWMVNSSVLNHEVTGGTVNVNLSNNNINFLMTASHPFFNLNVNKSGAGSAQMILRDINWSFNGATANTATIEAKPLVVLNNLNISSANSPILNAGDEDVILGGNFTVNTNATYATGNNATKFNGINPQNFTVNGFLNFNSTGGSNLINGPENIVPGSNFTFERLTSQPNVELAPNNTLTAERILETNQNGLHQFYTPEIASSGPMTASIFVKPDGRTCVALRVGRHAQAGEVWFNLTGSGSIISQNAQVSNATIEALSNGWYRISATTEGHNQYRARIVLGNNSCNFNPYWGDVTRGIIAWGMKVENTEEPSPYVPSSFSGINTLEVNKANGSTVNLSGTIAQFELNGSLLVNTGNLNINAKNTLVKGNIINNTLISGSAKIRLIGTQNQNIGGNDQGIFTNLELANQGGTAGNEKVTCSANFRVNGTLEMSTDRVFNIRNRRIVIAAAGNIVSTSGNFGINRFIKTNGNLSDGGISKEYSASATSFVFPFGSGNNYTPATIAFNTAPAQWGSLNVRPVAAPHLYITNPVALPTYWKVIPTGFSGVGANSVNLTFNYGNLPDNAAYIPGYYNFQNIAYTSVSDVNAVNESTKNIHFNNFSFIDGDFTAGVPAAFGTVVPYYSRQNGNWNTPNTWSNVTFGGAASTTVPNSNVPVFIGNGTSIFHTVTVTQNNTISGSLIVDAGSTLDLGSTTGNNFGALPYATAGGAGRIRISSSNSTAEFPAGDFGLFFQENGGTAEYYTNGTNFQVPEITAAPTSMEISSYRNLNFVPENNRTITLPNSNLIVFNHFTVNGHSNGTAAFNTTAARTMEVRGNMNITSGRLFFPGNVEHSLQMLGNVSVGASGTIITDNSGSALHLLHLMGNLTNNGTISLNNSSRCEIVFNGNASTLFTGTNSSAVNNLSLVRLNKGNNQSQQLNLNVAGSFTTPGNDWLTLQNGTLQISRAINLTITNQAGSNFVIPSSAALVINHTDAEINIGMAAANNADLVLAGKLEILNGTVNIGNSANNNHNDIEYAASGAPELIVRNNSTLNVNGQIRRSLFVLLGALRYTQSDNSVVLVRGRNPEAASAISYDRAKFEILNQGSSFNMSGNALLIIDRTGNNSNLLVGEMLLNPTSSSVSGGEIRFGTANTAAATFNLTSFIPLWNVSVDGMVNNKTLRINSSPLIIQRDLRILGNSIFNANSLDVTIGGNLLNENTTNANGLNEGGYRVISSSQVTTFNGSSGSQNVTGASGNQTVFANLVINNTSVLGSVNLLTNARVRITGNLTINQGNLNLNENMATVLGHVTNNQQCNSTLPGHLNLNGSLLQNINGNGNGIFGSITVNNPAGVNVNNTITVNGQMSFQSGIVYINNHLLTFGPNATVAGTFNSSSMIRLNGVLSDGGVRKLYPTGAHDFTFPVGVTLKYTPARFNVSQTSSTGSITIKPVNAKHPATTDPADKELVYYWNVNASGFGSNLLVSHEYNYHPSDATNGSEAAYVTGRYFNNVWFPVNGIPGTVNAMNDRITLTNVNYLTGDYTAGESTEFFILQTYFSRNATLGGDWNDVNTWSTDPVLQHDGAPASVPPSFNHVIIAGGHTVNVINNNRTASVVELNGMLNLGATIGHNFGSFSGTGILRLSPNAGTYVFPGGDYSAFTSSNGGTVNYHANFTGTIPTQAVYNNISFSGPGGKNMANVDILVNGDFQISDNGTVVNTHSRQINLKKNWINNAGVIRFTPNNGTVILSGGAQNVSGATNFYNLQITGGGIKTLSSSINVSNLLSLNDGIIQTNSNELIVQVGGQVSGASASSYVNGNFRRFIASNSVSRTFDVGDANHYTPVTINFSGNTNNTGSLLVNTSPEDHPQIYTSGVNPDRSVNRIWTITNSGVTGFTSYNVVFSYANADLDPTANPMNLGVARIFASVWSRPDVGVITSNSVEATGLTQFGAFQLGEIINGIIWTGNVNTNWNDAGNWLPNLVPGATDNIFVGVVTNQPFIQTGNDGFCREVNLDPGVTVSIASGKKLYVHGRWAGVNNSINGEGTVVFNAPGLILNGSAVFNGSLEVAENASLSLASNVDIEIVNNLSAFGAFNANGRTVTFSGNQHSSIFGSPLLHHVNLNKANSNLRIELNGNVGLSGRMDMISGDLNLNGFDVNLGSTGEILNETAQNKIYGSSGRLITERILNAPNAMNIAGLGAVITSAVNMGMTQVIRGHEQRTFNGGFGANRYYEVHPSNNSNLNATFRFHYHQEELNTPLGLIPDADLDMWRFDGDFWNFQWAEQQQAQGYLEKTNIPQFSVWTIGSRTNSPLPVSLLGFEGVCNNGAVHLQWSTASESNNHYFTIEESETGAHWYEMHREEGNGNSNQTLHYDASFKPRYEGSSYFRLKQVDYNGETTVYDPIYISCKTADHSITILPNPVKDFAGVRINAGSDFDIVMNMFSSAGQIIFSQKMRVRRGENEFRFDMTALPQGAYHLQISSNPQVNIAGNKTIIKK